jgi:PEGA domain-containing protein
MRLVALCVVLLGVVLFATPARAEPTEADRATARALALEGHTALKSKDYATAADRFGRADALVHAPTLLVDWARALQGLGRYVEAHEKYELVLREGVNGSSPKSWLRALEEAKKELDALKPRLGWVTVILQEPAEASVRIDGAIVPPAAVGVKRAADPGFPEVTVTAAGYEPFKQTVTVGPGEEKTIEVTLRKLPEAPTPTPTSTDAYRPRQKSNARRVWSYVAFGVGGVGLVAGGVSGGLALRKRGQLKDACHDDGRCRSSQAKRISTYYSLGTTSGVTLAVGVAGLGTGLLLLLTEPRSSETAHAGISVRPLLGFGSIGAEGSFQ